jgi:hypothetical protein
MLAAAPGAAVRQRQKIFHQDFSACATAAEGCRRFARAANAVPAQSSIDTRARCAVPEGGFRHDELPARLALNSGGVQTADIHACPQARSGQFALIGLGPRPVSAFARLGLPSLRHPGGKFLYCRGGTLGI